jgi:hypothetical protein
MIRDWVGQSSALLRPLVHALTDTHVGPRQSPIAREALERIGQLYAVEAGIVGKPPDHRQSEARPLTEQMQAWFTTTLRRISGRSDIATAI